MQIKRTIYNKLLQWKIESNGKTALLIEGARRTGKTTIAKRFGENEYRSCLVIDFNNAPNELKRNFTENLNSLDVFFQNLSLIYNMPLYRRDSLIIFDEVQSFPKAREAIKYLVEDGRYDYIETGSLISIKENVKDITIPSEEDSINMYPCTFDEFVSALGEDVLLEYIRSCWEKRIPLEQSFHAKAMRLFNEYILVGGMPQSIVAYVEGNRDFYASDKEKRKILKLYRADIKKASQRYSSRVSAIFEMIPGYLSSHEKRVKLAPLFDKKSRVTFSSYDEPFFWLEDSMICNLCYKCTDPNVGFALTQNDSFLKCYMGDTGLLFSLAFSENEITSNKLYKAVIDGKLSLNKGMLFENVIAQTLRSKEKKLFFYSECNPVSHRNTMEIDFLLSNESSINPKVIPIEVKSSKNYRTTSLTAFREKFGKRISESYIIHPKMLQTEENLVKLPPYMLWCF